MTMINQVFGLPSSAGLVNKSHPALITDDMVGIEVELEGLTPGFQAIREAVDPRWNVIEDGSLRNMGMEFVFGAPMFGTDVVEAVTSLTPLFEELGVVPSVSERTSVHVHLDVRDLEYGQLLNLVIVYLLCEPYFFAVGGEDRKNNAYTTPLAQSTDYLTRIGRALRSDSSNDGQVFRSRIDSNVKYSAFNVAPVVTQGSVEFRHHRGTYDTGVLLNWVNMVLAVKRYTVSLGNQRMTTEFIDNIVNGGYEEFIEQVFRGVAVPFEVDGWSNAARVAKRVATIAQGDTYRSPMLSIGDDPAETLFAVAQQRVGRSDLGNFRSLVVSLKDYMRLGEEVAEVEEEGLVDDYLPRISPAYTSWLRHRGFVDSSRRRSEWRVINGQSTVYINTPVTTTTPPPSMYRGYFNLNDTRGTEAIETALNHIDDYTREDEL